MSISRIKQIKQIVKDHPVTDPRGALAAIEQVLAQPKQSKPEADTVLQLTLRRSGSNRLECVVKTNPKTREAGHVIVAIKSLQEFGSEMYGCDDPDCPVHGTAATVGSDALKGLFDKITKGNLQ